MNLSIKDYAGRVRGSVWEQELAQKLRLEPETDRFEFLSDLLVSNQFVALDLARKCLSENRSFELLLDRALLEANSSGIRHWLECVVPRLGIRRVIAHLHERMDENREAVRRAKYWLPMFSKVPGYSEAEIETLRV